MTDIDLEKDGRGVRPGVIAGGAILLALGGAMLLSTSGAIDVPVGRLIGPFALIALGTMALVEKGGLCRRGGGTGGLWLIGIGAWMLISQTHLWGLTFATSWPLFLILSGVGMLVRGLR